MSEREAIPGEATVTKSSDDPRYRPLGTYAGLTTAFLGVFGTMLVRSARRETLPKDVSFVDLALVGVASHKLARLVATDEVTAFMRAPFVEVSTTEDGEIQEEARGKGLRRAVGELITCPSCVGLWLAASVYAGSVRAPTATRAVASVFAVDTVSDFLHVAYRGLKDRA